MAVAQKGSSRYFDTLIIGAGISGLACAARLRGSGRYGRGKTFAVLEARDRIGGRINAVMADGCRLDTGANWIHGTGDKDRPNPILEFATDSQYRALKTTVSFRTPSTSSREDLVMPPDIASDMFRQAMGLIGSLHGKAEDSTPEEAKNVTMLAAVQQDDAFRDNLEKIPGVYRKSLAGIPQLLESFEAAPLNHQSAERSEDGAGMSLLEFKTDGFDGDHVFLKDGYMNVINGLAGDSMAEGHIKLNTEVLQILWHQTPIQVVTTSGSYTAQNVVCTLPLGVLKHGMTSSNPRSEPQDGLFSPPLPGEKFNAIKSLGYGTLDKIFMVYSSPWWTKQPYLTTVEKGMGTESPSRDSSKILEPDSFRGFTTELPGIYVDLDGIASGPAALFVINLHALSGFPVLAAFACCANALRIEALSDHEAGNIVERALTEWFGGVKPPAPSTIHVTRWAQDKYSRGSYSNMITGRSAKSHRNAFQAPIINDTGGQLRFAGEHTSMEDFATAHGALLSGRREADALLGADEEPYTK